MRMLGVLLVALALVGVALAARTASVTVRDGSFTPVRVRIDNGGSITWRNSGSKSHRIASRAGAFAAFTLAPRARKAVRFSRNGTHRYTVDGKGCGVIYVGVPLGPACSGGGAGTATPPPAGTKIYTYNVVVRGSFKNEGYVDDDTGRRTETWMHEYTWNSTFTSFKFKVVTAGGKAIGVNTTAPRGFPSLARVNQKWKWLLQAQTQGPPNADCGGVLNGGVRSVLVASASNFSKNFYVAFQVPGGWDKRSEIEARCSGLYPPTEATTPFALADGTRVDMSVTLLTLTFERETGGLRNPAGALLNGRSFTIDTRVKVSEKPSCEGACSGKVTITERYIAVFTRRP